MVSIWQCFQVKVGSHIWPKTGEFCGYLIIIFDLDSNISSLWVTWKKLAEVIKGITLFLWACFLSPESSLPWQSIAFMTVHGFSLSLVPLTLSSLLWLIVDSAGALEWDFLEKAGTASFVDSFVQQTAGWVVSNSSLKHLVKQPHLQLLCALHSPVNGCFRSRKGQRANMLCSATSYQVDLHPNSMQLAPDLSLTGIGHP